MTGSGKGPNEPDFEETAPEPEAAPSAPGRSASVKTGPIALPPHAISVGGRPSDTLVPPSWVSDFAEEISDDLVCDAADSLHMIRAPSTGKQGSGGINLSDIGGTVDLRHITQKILLGPITAAASDEDDTVVDLGTSSAADSDETEELHARVVYGPDGQPVVREHTTEDLEPPGDDEA